MDFSKFLASPENDEDEKWEGKDKSIKTYDEKDSSLVRRRSSQCIDKESKKTDEARTDNAKRGPSADEEGRNTGSVAGKVFSGYLLAGSNCFVVFFETDFYYLYPFFPSWGKISQSLVSFFHNLKLHEMSIFSSTYF